MQRILDPAQIEAFAQRQIRRFRLADPAHLFLRRAERLRRLSETSSIGDYLALLAAVSEAQHRALAGWTSLPEPPGPDPAESRARIARAREHDLPVLQALGWPRDARWRVVLTQLCEELAQSLHATVSAISQRLIRAEVAGLEAQADRLLGASPAGVDLQGAPLLMAALQVYWVQMATTLNPETVQALEVAQNRAGHSSTAAVCPVCGTLPLLSIVRADGEHQGYRYLHCALCATEWHFVRIKCSHCLATEGIRYHYLDGGSDAIRAESCESCRTYRKILYQEKDPAVEPVADDLGSLALDLLMSAERYHRVSGNPFLWQPVSP